MDYNEEQILDMLRHYKFQKGLLTNKTFQKAINMVLRCRNPFLNPAILKELNDEADNHGYAKLNSKVFSLTLEHDTPLNLREDELEYKHRNEAEEREYRVYRLLSFVESRKFWNKLVPDLNEIINAPLCPNCEHNNKFSLLRKGHHNSEDTHELFKTYYYCNECETEYGSCPKCGMPVQYVGGYSESLDEGYAGPECTKCDWNDVS